MSTSSDSAVRSQLVSGIVAMAITSRPLTGDYLADGSDEEALAAAELVYAPLAVTSGVIAYLANDGGVKPSQLRLSPRLIAKALTHSYAGEAPLNYYSVKDGFDSRWLAPALTKMSDDPEFLALNPEGFVPHAGTLVVTGPNSADGIAQLWAYLQADDAARAFLAGEPDNVRPGDEANSGITLNPYYLPKGHPDAKVPALYEGEYRDVATRTDKPTLLAELDQNGNAKSREVGLTYADGSPLCLCDAPVDSFLKADETQLPQMLNRGTLTNQYRYDILQMRPYAASLESAARMVFRADNGSKTDWDNSKFNGATMGAYGANGMAAQTSVFMAGYTDGSGAARYGLATAALAAPNQPGVFVQADQTGLAEALAAQSPSGAPGVGVTDPAALPAAAYPLTSVLYAAVNLAATDQAARDQYADLIEFVATSGQTPGNGIGELPDGYLPLSAELRDQALEAVQTIRDYTSPDQPDDQGDDDADQGDDDADQNEDGGDQPDDAGDQSDDGGEDQPGDDATQP
ncbi:MAG: hypothetical protein LBD70_04375, partial [Bifidobacteriaceae bacterium]|nr:hypothetical protein [Bifidobacteriaceae bacterium]